MMVEMHTWSPHWKSVIIIIIIIIIMVIIMIIITITIFGPVTWSDGLQELQPAHMFTIGSKPGLSSAT
jgi:hypothetical protein